ncbi:MAG: hypothetical protein D3920_06970 [Candidatus Electrothrix sp. AW2]|nr:hypothetical protein [Candidatus Electrothrix sp. AX1]MCI5117089.1 hypothetical protein [Candidatus Electrothrix gigas]MCI5127117.1 hypothetical protein [Candidatus Electrothrix gigas]MCI5134806.1 hypothetical protein [Candidatus Electrothrix gigas]MCI5178297.1 hypothetical protein [Candidatus Electrothrix gigas]
MITVNQVELFQSSDSERVFTDIDSVVLQ